MVDGHGDLIADDVFCLPDGPRVLDCLEFDDQLRHVDALDDVAFLAMDLERLGRADLGTGFLDAYAEFAGDPAPTSLRHHYIAYRALVRAKVACLRHDQTGAGADAGIAVRYSELSRVTCVEERCGWRWSAAFPERGSPRSRVAWPTAAERAAVLGPRPQGARRSRSRRVRHRRIPGRPLQHRPHRGPLPAPAAAGRTTPRAGRVGGTGRLVDGRHHRTAAAALAARSSSDLVALECRAPAQVAAQRIHDRGATASDATAAIAAAMAAAADPWPDAIVVDTTAAVDRCLADAIDAWNSAPNSVLRVG